VLAKYIEIHPDTVRNKSVLEVGAGTGVAGTAAALLGAREILLTGETKHSTAQGSHTLPPRAISLILSGLLNPIFFASSACNTTHPICCYCYAQILTTLWIT
jgi:Lysine methyltransferase